MTETGRSVPTLDDADSARTKQRLLWAAILASFVSFLDGTIVTIALPAIEKDLHGGIVTQQWVVSGYLLTLSAFILVAGAVSDAFGQLRILRIAIVAFSVTSLACALAPTAELLIAARVLQGVAGALLVPGSLSLIIATFDGEAQSKAIGRWTGWTSVSGLAGPLLGGVLVDALGWRSVFVLSVLPAIGSMVLLGRIRDPQHDGPRQRIDVPAAVLTAVALGGITTGLIERARLGNPLILGALVVGVVALVAFLVQNARADAPLVPLDLFSHRNFAAGNIETFVVYGALALAGLVPTLYLQERIHLTATAAALVGLPATLLLVLLSGRFGALSGRLGPRLFMTAGPAVAALGFLLMLLTPPGTAGLWFIVPGLVILGLGLSATVSPLTAAILGDVPHGRSGIGSAVNNAVSRVAGLISTASIGAVIGATLDLPAFHRSVLLIAVLLLVGAAIAFVGIRNPKRTDAAT